MLWSFMYHRGPAPLQGIIETEAPDDERVAMAVATIWCQANGMRPPASVRPMILADESIVPPGFFEKPPETEVPRELPDVIAATTGGFVAGVKAAFRK